ncbi:MAG TPA: helix-turn-helix domain-containing protein [Candidatus Methylomirabilis sp.]
MLLSIANASEELDVHPITIRRLISSGRIPALRIGRKVLIRRDALEQFVKRAESEAKRGRPR